MSNNSINKYISVFIPTFNGEKYIGECIDAVLNQHMPRGYTLELIIIDSGSKDKTVGIVKKYGKRINFSSIPNSEFGHGKTRSKAAHMAKGEFVLFLTQDATPSNYRWIINMIEPFFLSDKVGCVFGRQIPRPFSVPTIKREVSSVFGAIGAPDSIIIHRHQSLVDATGTNTLNSFFSDVNSAVRRNLLVSEVPFRDLPYAEDQALAEDMQTKGYLKAYAPIGSVWHSNEYTYKEYYYRKFDEYIGLQESVGTKLEPSTKSLALGWIRPTMHDWSFTRNDTEYNKRAKFKFFFLSPLYNISMQLGKYMAAKHINNPVRRKEISLETKLKG